MMLTFAKTLAVLAFTGAVTAKPVPGDGQTFSLESNTVPGAAKHQLEHMVEMKRSLGLDVHPKLAEAANQAATKRNNRLVARKATGTARGRSADAWDTEFFYDVTFGENTCRLFLPTTNSELIYHANPAHRKAGANFSIGYFGRPNDMFGDIYIEPVTLGGVTAKTAFGAISQAADIYTSDPENDGTIGFGLKKYNSLGENTWFDNAKPLLAKPLFAIGNTKGHGSFDFGFINPKKVAGPITWVNNRLDEGWAAYGCVVDGFSLADPNAKTTPRKMNVHFTSGTDLTFLPPDIVKAWYALIPGAVTEEEQGYTIPCDSKPPGWTVVIGGRKFFTPGSQLVSQPVDDAGKVCLGGLQNIGGGVDFSLYGNNFFKGKYVIHLFPDDKPENIKLGFALQPGSQ